MSLMIDPISVKDVKISVKIDFGGEIARDIEFYRDLFKEDYGQDLPLDTMVRECIRIALAVDKEFQRRRKVQESGKKPPKFQAGKPESPAHQISGSETLGRGS